MREALAEANMGFELNINTSVSPKALEGRMNDYWSERAQSYSTQNMCQFESEKRTAWEELIFYGIDETKPLKVLDIGTGPGFFAILAALRGHEVTAADMNADMLFEAQLNAKKAGCKINFVHVGDNLPFAEESFDLIISRDVTWTLTEPERQLSLWAGKLKKGGVMRYFDAQWYNFLLDENAVKKHEYKKEEVAKNGGFTYKKAYKLNEIAQGLPMTYNARPLWDRVFWSGLGGFGFDVYENLNRYVYNKTEQMQYELFPEFMVSVKKAF